MPPQSDEGRQKVLLKDEVLEIILPGKGQRNSQKKRKAPLRKEYVKYGFKKINGIKQELGRKAGKTSKARNIEKKKKKKKKPQRVLFALEEVATSLRRKNKNLTIVKGKNKLPRLHTSWSAGIKGDGNQAVEKEN